MSDLFIPGIKLAAKGGVNPSPPDSPPKRLSIAVGDLSAQGVPKDVAATLTDIVASELSKFKVFDIITSQEVQEMLSHEQQKQLVGCESDISCLTEIGGALGARFLAIGSVGKLGETYIINLQLVDVRRARITSREKSEMLKSADAIPASAARLVQKLVRPLLEAKQGFLSLSCSEEGANVKVDDTLVGVTPLERLDVNWGPHTVKVEREGFIAYARDIDVESGRTSRLDVRLIPSQEFIEKYETRAKTFRTLAWTSSGLALAGLGLAGFFEFRARSAEDDHNGKVRELESAGKAIVGPNGYTITDEAARLTEQPRLDSLKDDADQNTLISRVALGAGVAVGLASLYFWLAGDSMDRYEEYRGEGSALLFTPQRDGALVGIQGRF